MSKLVNAGALLAHIDKKNLLLNTFWNKKGRFIVSKWMEPR